MSTRPNHAVLATLRRLEDLLRTEAEALRAMNVAGIEAAARAKETLEPELAEALQSLRHVAVDEATRQEIRAAHARVVALGRDNHARLQASLSTVEGLVAALTGQPTTTYGRPGNPRNPYRSTTPPAAVLTSEVG